MDRFDPATWQGHMGRLKWTVSLIVLMAMSACASIPTGGKNRQLDWRVNNEVLTYRTCGCADSCWVAELRSARAGAIKARLHCDCERLYFQQSKHANEQLVAESCGLINDSESKFDAIPGKMQELLQGVSAD